MIENWGFQASKVAKIAHSTRTLHVSSNQAMSQIWHLWNRPEV